MKNFMIILILALIGGCATLRGETVMPAKMGLVMCPNLGAIPFTGDVILNGSWVVFTPIDTSRIKKVAASNCIVTVTREEVDQNEEN